MELQRLVFEELKQWKQSSLRKPLILRGARQVGKTTLIRSFGRTYTHFIELNLELSRDQAWFENFDHPLPLMEALLLSRNIPTEDLGKTLLFIDEIQEVPKALSMLRYFYEQLEHLHVVAAGSLLEFALHKVGSFPVGRVSFMYLEPLNFQEYLAAHGKTLLLAALREYPIRPTAHPLLMEAFHRYTLIGGMPEIVAAEVKGLSVNDLQPLYQNLWDSYLSDLEKYAGNDTELRILRHVVQTAPFFMDQRIAFQGFGNSNYRSREVGEALRMLDDARFIRLIYPTTSVEIPAPIDFDRKPRLQFLDTGLVHFGRGSFGDILTLKDFHAGYRGALLPHVVTQELISADPRRKPAFWVREKNQASAEVDLVVQHKEALIPVEIKSGPTGRLRSLHEFMDRAPHDCAIRLHAGGCETHRLQTRKGKAFTLLDVPYYLGGILPLDHLPLEKGGDLG